MTDKEKEQFNNGLAKGIGVALKKMKESGHFSDMESLELGLSLINDNCFREENQDE